MFILFFSHFSSGVEHGNLRELALARMKEFGTECRDVRTREVGIQEVHHKLRPYSPSLSLYIYCDSQMCQVKKKLFINYFSPGNASA